MGVGIFGEMFLKISAEIHPEQTPIVLKNRAKVPKSGRNINFPIFSPKMGKLMFQTSMPV
jgi:hypothetical protein